MEPVTTGFSARPASHLPFDVNRLSWLGRQIYHCRKETIVSLADIEAQEKEIKITFIYPLALLAIIITTELVANFYWFPISDK